MTSGALDSLVPRPSTPPVFDHLQCAKMEGEGLGNLIKWSAARPSLSHRCSTAKDVRDWSHILYYLQRWNKRQQRATPSV